MGDNYFGMNDSKECISSNQLSEKKEWLGSFFNCFSNVTNMLGGKRNAEEPWEVPFNSIHALAYLGSGAQGVVFSGCLRGEMVAVKKVREKEETDVKHLRKLTHENIVRFRGICNEDPNYCLIMEYCQYGSLFEFLHSGTNLLPEQVMKWAKDIALGMAYLHSHKIIHRDLKSPNVLIADDLTVKVSDFGTSREWEDVSTIMSFTGTVAWMAPEVIRHEPCSEKVDVWSFGVVLWELMTREAPFKNLETHAIMWGVGTDSLALPIPTGCPGSLQVIMCQTWQRIPKNRPPFKIIAAHLEMATGDIVAIGAETFAARQSAWGAEARESMEKIYAQSEKGTASVSTPAPAAEVLKPREELRQVKEVYEKQIVRANQLFMEVCAVRLQLEQKETALAEREKLLMECRCGHRLNSKFHRQSSTSSDGRAGCSNRRYQVPARMLVNYVDKEDGTTYTVAVNVCMCNEGYNNNVVPEPAARESVVERNGNVSVDLPAVHRPRHSNAIPDVAQV